MTRSRRYAKKAETLKLQAEKIKLEAERDALLLKQERAEETLAGLRANLTKSEQRPAPRPLRPEAETVLTALGVPMGEEVGIKNPFKSVLARKQATEEELEREDVAAAAGGQAALPPVPPEVGAAYAFELVAAYLTHGRGDGAPVVRLFCWVVNSFCDTKYSTKAEIMEEAPQKIEEKFRDYIQEEAQRKVSDWTQEEREKVIRNTMKVVELMREMMCADEADPDLKEAFLSIEANFKNKIKNKYRYSAETAMREVVLTDSDGKKTVFTRSADESLERNAVNDAFFDGYFPEPLTLSSEEIETLQKEVFGWDCFYPRKCQVYDGAVLFPGTCTKVVKGPGTFNRNSKQQVDFDKVNEIVQEKLARSSLVGRVRLHFIKDPRLQDIEKMIETTGPLGFLESMEKGPDPVFIATTRTEITPPGTKTRVGQVGGLLGSWVALVFFALLPFAAQYNTFDAGIPDLSAYQDLSYTPQYAMDTFSTFLYLQAGMWGSRRLVAALNGTKLGPLFWLPSWQLGVYGPWQEFREPPRTNNAIFDVSIAAPLFAFSSSLFLLAEGLKFTGEASQEVMQTFPLVPAQLFQDSLIGGTLAGVLAPGCVDVLDASTSLLHLHPSAVVGLAGLYVAALSMLPLGRTDGARALRACWGREVSETVQFFLILFSIVPLILGNLDLQFWYILLISGTDINSSRDLLAENELDEPGRAKKALHALLTVLGLVVFLPNFGYRTFL